MTLKTSCLFFVVFAYLLGVQGCTHRSFPLDGTWHVQRDLTQSQRSQRLGEWRQDPETEAEWNGLVSAKFSIREHSELSLWTPSGHQRFKLTVVPTKDELWMLTVWYKDRMYKLKAARVDDELRVLDSGQLYILKE